MIQVQRNSTQHGGRIQIDNTWAFGQTLAVVMIFADLNEVIHFFVGLISRQRKRSHKREEEAQQESNQTDIPLTSVPYRSRGLSESHLSGKTYRAALCEWGAQSHVAARDSPQKNLSSERELLNPNKENSHVQVTAVTGVEIVENPQIRDQIDQPVGTLR